MKKIDLQHEKSIWYRLRRIIFLGAWTLWCGWRLKFISSQNQNALKRIMEELSDINVETEYLFPGRE